MPDMQQPPGEPARASDRGTPRTAVIRLRGPAPDPSDPLPCDEVRRLLASAGIEVVVCDVAAVREPDVGTVDALARLQLVARDAGGTIRLRDVPPALAELLALCGLSDALPEERPDGPTQPSSRGGRPN